MDQPTIHIDAHSCVLYNPFKNVVYISQHSNSRTMYMFSFVVYAYKYVCAGNSSDCSLQLQAEANLLGNCTALALSNDGSVIAVGDDEKVTLWRSSDLFKKEEEVYPSCILIMIRNHLKWCNSRVRAL